MKKKLLLLFPYLILSIYCNEAFCQEDYWDVYIAEYEKGPGSITLNMDLIKSAPKKDLPFVLITGVTFSKCRPDGFPEKDAFDKLYEISDRIEQETKALTKLEHVGTFLYQCERLSYIYVSDTNQIREKLEETYRKAFPGFAFYINLKVDAAWQAYREFLYPSEEIQEYMSNEKVIRGLMEAGDRLTQARVVDHWLYFKSKLDRDKFIVYAKAENYTVVSQEYQKESALPYKLKISRVDKVDADAINEITDKLRKQAKSVHGAYDGWESIVVKD